MGTSFHRTANFSTNETVKYHDDACLFRFTQHLCQTFAVEPNRPYTWRFEFTFPHAASLVGPSPYHGPTESSGIYISERHLLPPTFERYFNSNHYSQIEYTIQAVFQFSDAQEPFTTELPPLDFLPVPRSPESSTFVEYVRPPERLSSSQLVDKKKSFRLSYRGKVSSATPPVDLVMKASLNSQVVGSFPFPIYACVEIDPCSGESVTMQSINIRVKSLKLCQLTFFRARKYRGLSSMEEFQETSEDIVLLNALPDHIVAEPQTKPSGDGKSTFFPATFEASIPKTTRPSFRTFNVNHNFQLKVSLEAEILGKKFEHKFFVESLTVLPSA